jgi:hypothetical protein
MLAETFSSANQPVIGDRHVARHLNGCSPSTVYIEELLDERAAALSPLGGNGNI